MRRNMKIKGVALVATVALLGGAAFVASGATGAYFSDSQPGRITGTIGCILVTPSGGSGGHAHDSGQDFAFTGLLPGAAQTITVTYQNTCPTNAEDVWLTFTNGTALSALNNLGTYGTIHVASTGLGAVGDVFDSANLNDRVATCGVLSPAGCWPLPGQLKVASNLGPNAIGHATFSFMYASALTTQPPAGTGVWNTYPVPAGAYVPVINPGGQTTVNPGESGNGLPYAVVATQLGITPGAVGTHP